MRRPASQAQLELPLAAASPSPASAESAAEPEPEPEAIPARLCARCGWYCPLTRPCPVCHTPPESSS